MAVSQIEEKILGRIARQTSFPTRSRPGNEVLSASLFQVLGLSILLSKKLVKARRLRKLDNTRDTKSLKLYHHIIWLAREGLAITEAHVLPYCQNGESGPECRVMAAKLRASFCHVFCLFHNFPPVSQLSAKSHGSDSSPSTVLTPKADNGQTRRSPAKSPSSGKENNGGRRRRKKGALRDPIPSMNSDTSYVTNPFAMGPARTPPPAGPPPPLPPEARRTPTRPPGLTPIDIPASQAAASFLLPPMNWVPLTVEHFGTAQRLAESLLPPANSLRLSIALEHAAFLWDCEKSHQRARHIARQTIKDVYASTEGLDDDEFLDASSLVQALGGIVRRGSNESTPRPSREPVDSSSPQTNSRAPPPIDRTIAVSPTKDKQQNRAQQNASPSQIRSILKTPERLSTVPEVNSTEAISDSQPQIQSALISPPISRLSNRSRGSAVRRSPSDKASKRKIMEQAEETSRRNSASRASGSEGVGSEGSRQPTPQEGLSTPRRVKRKPVGSSPGPAVEVASPSGGAGSGRAKERAGPRTPSRDDGAQEMATSRPSSRRSTSPPPPPRSATPPLPAMPSRKPVPPPKDPTPSGTQPTPHRDAAAEKGATTGAIPIVRDFAAPDPARDPAQMQAQARPRARPRGQETIHSVNRTSDPVTHARERREAVLRALEIIGSVSRGLHVPDQARQSDSRERQRRGHGDLGGQRLRVV